MSRAIALATCAEEPDLYDDDQLLLTSLRDAGINAVPLVWDDPNLDYHRFSYVLLRSVWDYHWRSQEFLAWLRALDRRGVRLFNSTAVVRSNLHKHYLRDLQQLGVPIVPSIFFHRYQHPNLQDLARQLGTDRLVIKPAIGASSYRISLIEPFRSDQAAQEIPLMDEQDFIVQKFMPEIVLDGEVSLVFIDRRFSHAVLKCACAGDFRVQDDFGGTFSYIEADPSLRRQARRVLDHIGGRLLYARVDGLYSNGCFLLMEVELIEPILYLHDLRYRTAFVELLGSVVEEIAAGAAG